MAAAHVDSSAHDCYSSLSQVVKSLEGGIHCNSFSKRGRQQSVEVKRLLEATATRELKPRVIGFASDLFRVIELCIKTSYATELRCRERSSVAFSQAQQERIPDLWRQVHRDLSLPMPDPLWTQIVSRLVFEELLVATLKSKHPQ